MRTFVDLICPAGRAVALLAMVSVVAVAQTNLSPTAARQIQELIAEKESRTPAQKKLDSHLHYAAKMMRGQSITQSLPTLPRILNKLTFSTTGSVLVDISGAVGPGLLNTIISEGGHIVASTPKYGVVRAEVPLASLDKVASRSDVTFIAPGELPVHAGNLAAGKTARVPRATKAANLAQAFRRTPLGISLAPNTSMRLQAAQTQTMDTSGVTAHGVNLVRSEYNLDGTGIRIGVLSDGVASLNNLTAQGYLPNVTVLPNMAGPTDGDEGTAMLEIVHDLAPGAQLFYATAYWGQYQTAANIEALRNTYNCDIIVDDITYLEEPVFQDGIIAEAINTVTASGALYFSAAGNSGSALFNNSDTWEGDFSDSGQTLSSLIGSGQSELHSFSPGVVANIVRSGAQSSTTLQWSDPFSQACNDYDLYVLDSQGKNVVSSSTNVQSCPSVYAPPIEEAGAAQAGEQIVIALHSGSPRALHLSAFRGALTTGTTGGTFSHNAAANAITVAAVPAWSANGGQFTSSSNVEGFSSDGPRRIFYTSQGQPFTPGNVLFASNGGMVLQKPEVAAADGVATAVPGFGAFYGTSAAAPHAAAIAALAKQADPNATTTQIISALKSTALDIMTPGIDVNSGYGILMALPAVNAMLGHVTGVASSTANGTYGVGSIISIDVSFDRAVLVSGSPQLMLNTGATAVYHSGAGTNNLRFIYQVASGQNTSHLDYASATGLTLAGGDVLDTGNLPVQLTLPLPGAASSLGANSLIAIDTVAPSVLSFNVGFGKQSFNLLGSARTALPWQITSITAVFSKPVAHAGMSSLAGVAATTVSGLNTNTLTWTISPLLAGRFVATLAASGSNAVTDAAGNPLNNGNGFSQAFSVLYGDFTGDAVVNVEDLIGVLTAMRQPYSIWADLDGDGAVGVNDLLVVRSHLGSSLK